MDLASEHTTITISVKKDVEKITLTLAPEEVQSAIIAWLHDNQPDLINPDPVQMDITPLIRGYGDWEYEGHEVVIFRETT